MMIREPKKLNLPFLLPLALLFLTIYLASDSIAYKLVQIGPLLEPGPPFIFPLSYAISNIIAEVYGISLSKKIIWFTLFFQLIYAIFVSGSIMLPPPANWDHQHHYDFVFGHLIQFILSGTIATSTSTFLNVYIIAKWKALLRGHYFWVRYMFSSLISEFVLISLIVVLGYANHLSDWREALRMFVSIYLFEFIYSVILIVPVWFICGYLKEKEQLDVYDADVRFNPFKFE